MAIISEILRIIVHFCVVYKFNVFKILKDKLKDNLIKCFNFIIQLFYILYML
jgi:hypothetical protein